MLLKEYKIASILGHEEISPGRKLDPGPAFPLDKLRERILYPNRDAEGAAELAKPKAGVVRANLLNIRHAPNATSEKIARPLPKGSKVKILRETDEWYYVAAEINGWVAKDYIESGESA